MTLVEFLTAMLDADEAGATEGARCGGWLPPEEREDWYRPHYPDDGWSHCDGCCAAEAADWPNARIQREVEAKRRIIASFEVTQDREIHPDAWTIMKEVVGDLAAVYAGHPDYREEWKQTVNQLPTVPGKVSGIVGWEPCALQCRVCGVTVTQGRGRVAAFIILSGFRFHRCEGRKGSRMCPGCLAAVVKACPSGRCKQ